MKVYGIVLWQRILIYRTHSEGGPYLENGEILDIKQKIYISKTRAEEVASSENLNARGNVHYEVKEFDTDLVLHMELRP